MHNEKSPNVSAEKRILVTSGAGSIGSKVTLKSAQKRSRSFMIATHMFTTGPADFLRDFLLKYKVKKLCFISHPFHYAPQTRSVARLYERGKPVKEIRAPQIRATELLLYFKDLILTLAFALILKSKFDIYVGADPLNAFAGIILKRIKFVRFVVFYTIDYIPARFNNTLVNGVYNFLDKICVEHCDFTWNLSEAMSNVRKSRGIKKGRQMVVPMGGNFKLVDTRNKLLFDRKRMVFLGHLRRNQGLELIISSLPRIIHEIPNAKLTVIGTGPLENKLKTTVIRLGLEKNVEFLGYIEDHAKVEDILSHCAFGLAPYEPSKESFTWYADPGKPKQYLTCGLPIIITRVPLITSEIEIKSAGLVIHYNEDELVYACLRYLKDEGLLLRDRKNALGLGSKYAWTNIFTDALACIYEVPNTDLQEGL